MNKTEPFTIVHNPNLNKKLGLGYSTFTLVLDKDILVPGDILAANFHNNDEDERFDLLLQTTGIKNTKYKGYTYTFKLMVKEPYEYIPNTYLKKDSKLFYIGAAYDI